MKAKVFAETNLSAHLALIQASNGFKVFQAAWSLLSKRNSTKTFQAPDFLLLT